MARKAQKATTKKPVKVNANNKKSTIRKPKTAPKKLKTQSTNRTNSIQNSELSPPSQVGGCHIGHIPHEGLNTSNANLQKETKRLAQMVY